LNGNSSIEDREAVEKLRELIERFPAIKIFSLFFPEMKAKLYYFGCEDKGFEESVKDFFNREIYPDVEVELYSVAPGRRVFEEYYN